MVSYVCMHERVCDCVPAHCVSVCVREREKERDHQSNHVDQWMSVS